ncbi:hypothetical protein QBC35DRAFT_149717 [Podospora australis]|uniref:COP9 signalosome complex subunit 6 n=1 Tax=Podospora australis TaxID=1536484 RepID=A0AAN6WW69_9PEZI|nr:hypothetical protein QBC35DRAFT_149717 [Podospora australis]
MAASTAKRSTEGKKSTTQILPTQEHRNKRSHKQQTQPSTAMAAANQLLSAQKASESGLQVALHPLPILEISDYITRGYQRSYTGAVVGGLLGQQNGREITIEHSFSCKTVKNTDSGLYELDQDWFKKRLDQMKLVHKNPQLDLVGWYSLVSASGPTEVHLPIHRQISAVNESAVLLGFVAESIIAPSSTGDSLPIVIYETNMEAEGEDKEMKDSENPTKMVLRFRQLPYTTETGEAEMIAMQYIREGGGNASLDINLEQFDKKIAVDDGKGKRRAVAAAVSPSTKRKGKGKAVEEEVLAQEEVGEGGSFSSPDANLSKVEAEHMAALQAKYNAIKMLKARVALIATYLQRLPPVYTSGEQTTAEAAELAKGSGGQFTVPSNNVLRHIQALVTNVELVTPTEQAALQRELQKETNDVKLISLISDLVKSVSEVREAGRKFHIVEGQKRMRHPGGNVFGAEGALGTPGGGGGGGGGPGGQGGQGGHLGGLGGVRSSQGLTVDIYDR